MPEYTLLTVLAVVAVVGAELVVIILAFQIPVDGWFTTSLRPHGRAQPRIPRAPAGGRGHVGGVLADGAGRWRASGSHS
jgi:hypothetical protein